MDWRDHRDTVGVTLLAVASAVAAAPVGAQDAPDGSTILFREGVERLRGERYEEAVEAFRGSYRLSPRVTTMCNLALTYDRWGPEHHEAAIRAYRTCAAEDDSGRYRTHALERITAIERELALAGDAPGGDDGAATDDGTATDSGTATHGGTATDDGVETSGDGAAPAGVASPPPSGYDRALLFGSIGAAGAAAIGLVTGVALALDAQSRVVQLEAETPDGRIVRGSERARRLDEARAIADGATAAYVIAGVLGAAAAGLLAVDLVLATEDDTPTATLRVTPTGVEGAF